MGKHEDTSEAGPAGGRSVGMAGREFSEKTGAVGGVAGTGTGIDGGVHARGTVEGVGFESGVVGQGGALVGGGGRDGFEAGIFLEGAASLIDLQPRAARREVGDLSIGGEQGRKLGGLVAVGGGNQKQRQGHARIGTLEAGRAQVPWVTRNHGLESGIAILRDW